jgi:A/G-specific adenine glycosylase
MPMKPKKRPLKSLSGTKGQEPEQLFVAKLLFWNKRQNNRQMPWKGESDPYKIWLSEVILQQTRVEQGLKYYENFIRAFPNVHALAQAQEERVYKLWEGLGYYSRCKNLITTAKYISGSLEGIFPKDFESIRQLKGIGNYTASAIASFAYNLPYAVLDGNVFRVLSRVFDIDLPIDSTYGKKYFSELAQTILPVKKAGEYNQAIMDFGAVICKPYPECKTCFFSQHCQAFLAGKQDLLPVKEKKQKVTERWFHYFIVRYKDQLLVRQRTSKDIWQQLFEFPLIETGQSFANKPLCKFFEKQYAIPDCHFKKSQSCVQKLSHQLIHFSFFETGLKARPAVPGFSWVKISELNEYAFPKTLQEFITNRL